MAGENERTQAGHEPTSFGSVSHHSTYSATLGELKEFSKKYMYFFFAKFH
jgi:hypothetical protein